MFHGKNALKTFSCVKHFFIGKVPKPAIPRRLHDMDTTPLGMERKRCTGQQKIDNEILRDNSLLLFNEDQLNAYNEVVKLLPV